MSSPQPGFTLRRADGTLKTPDELRADASRIAAAGQARAARLKGELERNLAEGSSRDQSASVTVNAVGGLQSVRLTDRVKTMTPPQIAAAIMQAYQEAAARATARTQEITAEELGDSRVVAEMDALLNVEADSPDAGRF